MKFATLRRAWTRAFVAALAVAGLAVAGLATPPAWGADPSAAEMPLGSERVEVEGGYKWDYVAGRKSEGWYKVSYRGTPVAERGAATKFSETLVVDPPAIDRSVADRSDLALRLENNTLALAGGLLDMEAVRPIEFAGLEWLDLRGTGFIASDRNLKQVNAAIGVEAAPWHPLGLERGIANWITVGVNGQRRDATDSATGDSNFVTTTYRAFVGKAHYVERGTIDVTKQVKDAFLKAGPTLDEAKKSIAAAGTKLSPLLLQLRVAVRQVEAESKQKGLTKSQEQELWLSRVDELARGRGKTKAEHPLYAVYAEASGWYEFRGKEEGRRQKNLFTVGFDYWFMPGRDDVFLRIRYENGFERGVPAEKKNHLLAAIAARF